jgi:transposase InsO family protein
VEQPTTLGPFNGRLRSDRTHQGHSSSLQADLRGPRIHAELAETGIPIGRKRVERLMKAAGLRGVSRRRGTRTTIRDERLQPASDLVDRNFYAHEPNVLWGAVYKERKRAPGRSAGLAVGDRRRHFSRKRCDGASPASPI